jgi:hypothetical protein
MTAGVHGLGSLGLEVAQKVALMCFRVSGWIRIPHNIPSVRCHSGEQGLEDCLRKRNFLVCLLPHTAETDGIRNTRHLALLELAACYRLFDWFCWSTLSYNISVLVPAAELQFLINPFGLHHRAVTARAIAGPRRYRSAIAGRHSGTGRNRGLRRQLSAGRPAGRCGRCGKGGQLQWMNYSHFRAGLLRGF